MAENPYQHLGEACNRRDLVQLCREAKKEIDKAYDKPPLKLGQEVDFAEVRIVRLRDCLIDELRGETDPSEQTRLKSLLDRVNVALSYVVGVEYPTAGIHRQLLEQARTVLKDVQHDLK